MPGVARRSVPVSALLAVQYAEVRLAARAPAIEADSKVIRRGDNDEKRARSRSAGVLSCRIRVAVRRTAAIRAISCAYCAGAGGRSTEPAEGHV